MSCTLALNSSSADIVFEGTATAGGAFTVTCAVASAVPPSPRATMWYEVDSDGVTVFTPVVGTSPMPSIATEVASVERQFSTTWSPAEIESGVAVICTVGAGAVAGGAIGGGGSGFFFLQPPATHPKARRGRGRRCGRSHRRWRKRLLLLATTSDNQNCKQCDRQKNSRKSIKSVQCE